MEFLALCNFKILPINKFNGSKSDKKRKLGTIWKKNTKSEFSAKLNNVLSLKKTLQRKKSSSVDRYETKKILN